MPYSRPTLSALRTQVLQSINAAQITDQNGNVLVALLQRAILRVIANAQAGLSYEHYGYLDWISLQAVPWTATDEFLDGWANLRGVYREAATPTMGTTTFTGSESIPAGTGIVRSDGFAYTATSSSISGSTVTAVMTANASGSAGNFDSGTQFNLQNSIAGVLPTSTASSQTTAGTDTQTDDSLRTEMLTVYAAPPQGGAARDYVEWALTVPGVTRAWVAPLGNGAGTVIVYVMLDEAEAAFGGFPQGTNGVATFESRGTAAVGDQLTVANIIFPLRPVTALVYVDAPTAQPTDFAVGDLGTNNTTPMQTAITAALEGMFLQLANVGSTVNPETGASWPSIAPSAWYAALEAIPGLTTFEVTSPSSPLTPSAAGDLLTLGTITFST